MPVSEKNTENSERLGRQVLPGIEHGTSHLPVLRAEDQTRQLVGHNSRKAVVLSYSSVYFSPGLSEHT